MAEHDHESDARDVLARVKLLALDVDGTLTDGSIAHLERGEIQTFDVHDGQGLAWLRKFGVKITWITGRGCEATSRRAKELQITEVFTRVKSKIQTLREVQERLKIHADETASMGDDLPDLGLKAASGFFCAPANARAEVREQADLVTQASGGHGAVRELCEAILRAKGHWQEILDAQVR